MVKLKDKHYTVSQRKKLLRERDNKLKKITCFEELLDISLKTFTGVYPLISSVDTFITDSNVDLESLIDENSNKLNKDGLLIYEMNKKGFLTLNSQSGVCSNNENISGKDIFKQRAYVSGIISMSEADYIHRHINDENIICIYIDNNTTTKDIQGIPVTYSNKTANQPKIATTHVHLNSEYHCIENLLNKKMKTDILENYVTIHFIDTKFGRNASRRNGLFTKINKILDEYQLID